MIGTSTPAILLITAEVCVMTTVLGFAMAALPGLEMHNGEVDAPGAPGVRDYLLRHMGRVFVGDALGLHAGQIASLVISILFGLLLLSAVNTAMVALSSLTHLMARDSELPRFFFKLNRHGVPIAGLLLSIIIPATLVVGMEDISKLADLYAVGVVGAITLNLGATSTDPSREMKTHVRIIMFLTFLLMAAVEITLLVMKPNARWFAIAVVAVGLLMRWMAKRSVKPLTAS